MTKNEHSLNRFRHTDWKVMIVLTTQWNWNRNWNLQIFSFIQNLNKLLKIYTKNITIWGIKPAIIAPPFQTYLKIKSKIDNKLNVLNWTMLQKSIKLMNKNFRLFVIKSSVNYFIQRQYLQKCCHIFHLSWIHIINKNW